MAESSHWLLVKWCPVKIIIETKKTVHYNVLSLRCPEVLHEALTQSTVPDHYKTGRPHCRRSCVEMQMK